jgi:predicted enzyme related to lactoylglutathione lyase
VPGGGSAPRSSGQPFREAGPLGVGFTTLAIAGVHARLVGAGVAFASEPLRLTPEAAPAAGPVRYEAFGRGPDGDGVVLIERLNTPTPYGTLSAGLDVSEPLHVSIVVEHLEASSLLLRSALGHATVFAERCEGPLFERLMALAPGTRFRFEMLKHPAFDTGRVVLIAFEAESTAAAPEPSPPRAGGRGIVALRYDTDDVEATLAAATASGAALVRPPVEIAAPLVGRARVAVVEPPWGGRLELWQPAAASVA